MIGGGGPRVVALAASEADIVSINNVPFDAVNEDGLSPEEDARARCLFSLIWTPREIVGELGTRAALGFARDTLVRGAAVRA
jgi:hypothetical protein